MKYILIILAIVVVAYVGYEYVRISRLVRISTGLVESAKPFVRAEGLRSMLVLGDSTAVGVGSAASESVAGRLSTALDMSVENYSKSGARTDDVGGQLKQIHNTKYDVILIQVGANDVIRFLSIRAARDSINAILTKAGELSDHVVLLTGGKIGNAPLFPKPFGFLWIERAATLRGEFVDAAQKHDAVYVDLFNTADAFDAEPERYYASDGLHLTSEGYRFWFEETRKAIEKKWPEL